MSARTVGVGAQTTRRGDAATDGRTNGSRSVRPGRNGYWPWAEIGGSQRQSAHNSNLRDNPDPRHYLPSPGGGSN